MGKSCESPDVIQASLSLGLGKGPEQPETVDPGGGFQALNIPLLSPSS